MAATPRPPGHAPRCNKRMCPVVAWSARCCGVWAPEEKTSPNSPYARSSGHAPVHYALEEVLLRNLCGSPSVPVWLQGRFRADSGPTSLPGDRARLLDLLLRRLPDDVGGLMRRDRAHVQLPHAAAEPEVLLTRLEVQGVAALLPMVVQLEYVAVATDGRFCNWAMRIAQSRP